MTAAFADRCSSVRPSQIRRRTPSIWGRPSAATVDGATGVTYSSGSNYGPLNVSLTDEVSARVAVLRATGVTGPIPVDLVTKSASGLDPHISPAAAEVQVPRVARARAMSEASLRALIATHTEGRTLGLFFGEARVNARAQSRPRRPRGALTADREHGDHQMRPSKRLASALATIGSLCARVASAQTSDAATPAATPTPAPVANVSEGTSRSTTRPDITLSGYVETFYQWNFNAPSNGVTNYRGFDNRHNAVTLSNVVPHATGTLGPVTAHLALQFGHTPESYYLGEPSFAGASGAGASNSNVGPSSSSRPSSGGGRPWARGSSSKRGSFSRPSAPRGWR